jgi:hypothetical protein
MALALPLAALFLGPAPASADPLPFIDLVAAGKSVTIKVQEPIGGFVVTEGNFFGIGFSLFNTTFPQLPIAIQWSGGGFGGAGVGPAAAISRIRAWRSRSPATAAAGPCSRISAAS